LYKPMHARRLTETLTGTYKDASGSQACTSCAAGKYGTEIGASVKTACQVCAKGTFQESTSSRSCSLCPVGKYSDKLGAVSVSTCEPCGAHASSVAGSSDVTNCQCNRGYSGIDGGATCQACSPGKFKPESGNQSCTECPRNTSSAFSGSTSNLSCTCNLGYSGPDREFCTACRLGKFKDVLGTSDCIPCVEGKYGPEIALISESNCLVCPAYSYPAAGRTKIHCTCNAGYTGPDGGEECTACIAGTYKGFNGSSPCTLCSAGKYSEETHQTSESTCLGCPAETSSLPGSGSKTGCICNAGYSGPDGGICSACTNGQYKDVNGSSACSECPRNTFSSSFAATSKSTCISCPAGSISKAGSVILPNCTCNKGYGKNAAENSCEACEAGKYSNIVAWAPCITCPTHMTSPRGSSDIADCLCNAGFTGPNSGPCSECEAGTHKFTVGNALCSFCLPGTYALEGSSLCTQCPEKTYIDFWGARSIEYCLCNLGYTGQNGGPCTACEAGKYKQRLGNEACSPCPHGKYSAKIAVGHASECQRCPDHAYTVAAGSNAQTKCVCNIGYAGSSRSCNPCIAGFYNNVLGSTACSACPQGKYSAMLSSSSCLLCPENSHTLTEGSAVCKCNVGFHGPDGGACLPCKAGTYKDTSGSAACSECPAGTFSSSIAAVSDGTCTTCPSGTFSAIGSASDTECSCNVGYSGATPQACTSCVAGKYKDVVGTTSCLPCPRGTYGETSAAISQSQCVPCPANSDSVVLGSKNKDDCACNMGYTGENGQDCLACLAGTYKAVSGPMSCEMCPAGKFSKETGKTSLSTCTLCPPGKFSTGTQTGSCVDCPAGSFVDVAGSSTLGDCACNMGYTGLDGSICSACSAGSYKAVKGSAPCEMCSAGKFSSDQGANSESKCLPCPQGTYNTNTSQTSAAACIKCPMGSDAKAGSARKMECRCNFGYTGPDGGPCNMCVAGKYKDMIGSETCSLCSAGKYSAGVGEVSELTCIDCPANSISEIGSVMISDCKCRKGYAGPDGNPCAACVQGKFKEVTGSSECSDCPSQTWTIDGGQDEEVDCLCNQGYSGSGGRMCTSCPAGKYKFERGPSECLACRKGKYSSSTAQVSESTCISCPRGKYLPTWGGDSLAKCLVCSPGKISLEVGLGSEDACLLCAKGKYKISLTTCENCAPGTYRHESSAEACLLCPLNSNSSVGSDACSCLPGFVGPGGAPPCTACAPGLVMNMTGGETCIACENGKTNDTRGTKCSDCPPGTFSNPSSGGRCELCKINTFSDSSGSSSCTVCPPNTFTRQTEAWVNETGSSRLVFKVEPGATKCYPCPTVSVYPYYSRYEGLVTPTLQICTSADFQQFCDATENSAAFDLYLGGKLTVPDQEIPSGCPFPSDRQNISEETNRTRKALCNSCSFVEAAKEVAAALSTTVGAAVGASAAAGGVNPALIDQVQFMAIIGTGVCHPALLFGSHLCAACA
jgi:hypothetical protein